MANPVRSTVTRGDSLVFGVNLILCADGTARMTRQPCGLDRDERSLFLEVAVPKKLFETPTLRAQIDVPDLATVPMVNVDAARAALREALGVDVHIEVIPPPGDG